MERPTCPKCGKPAYRVYTETTSPKSKGGTGRSTKVPHPWVFCGTHSTAMMDGRVVGAFTVERGQHDMVPLNRDKFGVARRQSVHATSRSHPDYVAKRPRAAKPKTGPKTRPKARRAVAQRSGPSRASAKGGRKTKSTPTMAQIEETVLTEAGKALLAAAPAAVKHPEE